MIDVEALVGDLHVLVLTAVGDGRGGDRAISTRWVLSHRELMLSGGFAAGRPLRVYSGTRALNIAERAMQTGFPVRRGGPAAWV